MSFSRAFALRSRAAFQAPTVVPRRILPRHGRAYTTAADARTVRLSYVFVGAVLLSATSYVAGALAPTSIFQILNPRPAPPPPPAESEEGKLHTQRIEKELENLDMIKRCREAKDADEWYETRPYMQMPPERRANNFTAGALRGPGKIAVAPFVRARKDETEAWVFIHLGRGVCGHDGIVHGGLLATLLDEGCGRNAVLNVPSHIAVTANLNLDFKVPARADQWIVMKTRLVEVKGRKVIVEGRIEDMDGNLLTQARSIFVEPKFAKALSAGAIQAIFPTAGTRIAHMTGAGARDGQTVDEGAVKGK